MLAGKKPKSGREKSADSPDVISDLFAQMSLQMATEPSVPSESVLPNIMILESTTSTLDAPQPLQTSANLCEIQPEVPRSPCLTGTCSQPQSSLSVSAVLDELQLSSIDWDALSFTASASPQPQCSVADLRPMKNMDEEPKTAEDGSSTDLISEDGELAVPQADCLTDRPLWERVIMRNVIKSADSLDVREHLTLKVQNTGSEIKKADLSKNSNSSKLLCKNQQILLHSQDQKSGPRRRNPTIQASKKKTVSTETQQPKECLPHQVRPKYTFVKPKHSLISSVLRSESDTSNNRPSSDQDQTNQQSVCKRRIRINQGFSGEESDTEICLGKEQKKCNFKAKSKQHFFKKTVSSPHLTKQDRINTLPIKKQLNTVHPNRLSDSDEDDSDALIESPRPLAERLKLKFIK